MELVGFRTKAMRMLFNSLMLDNGATRIQIEDVMLLDRVLPRRGIHEVEMLQEKQALVAGEEKVAR